MSIVYNISTPSFNLPTLPVSTQLTLKLMTSFITITVTYICYLLCTFSAPTTYIFLGLTAIVEYLFNYAKMCYICLTMSRCVAFVEYLLNYVKIVAFV